MADIIFPGKALAADKLGSTKLPANMDLDIWQGDAQEYILKLTGAGAAPIDLTGHTAQAVLRSSFNSPTSYAFDCTVTDALNGTVRLYMSSVVSGGIPPGDYVWNFQVTMPNKDVRTYLAGDVTVYAEVD